MADCGGCSASGTGDSEAFRRLRGVRLPPHPGGECPSPDCRCSEMTDSIMARAEELAADRLGIDVAELR